MLSQNMGCALDQTVGERSVGNDEDTYH
jgi:hypothetical protein